MERLLFLLIHIMLHFLMKFHEIIAMKNHQPDYNKIVYGGAMKQVSLNPSEEFDDNFLLMKKKLKQHLQTHHPSAIFKESSVNCYAKLNLWYTQSDAVPIAFTNYVTGPEGEEYPISIPVSMGSVYNCEVRMNENQSDLHLFLTLTKEFWDEPFYIYSHIYYPVSKTYDNVHVKNNKCDRVKTPMELHVLSTLSLDKSLYNCINIIESELQERVKQVLLNSDLFASGPQSSPNNSPTFSVNLKVMTYNIWNFNPYYDSDTYLERLSNLLKLVKMADPDVICFQEVRFQNMMGGSKGPSQLEHITSLLLNYQYVYQPAQVQHNSLNEGRTEEGLAIFSKHPIIYHDYLLLFRNKSNSADGHQRICLHAAIVIPDKIPVHVFNTHYSLSHEAREKASSQILKFMTSYSGPAVLMGDLNAVPEEKAIKMLVEKKNGLIDAWTLLHGTEPGFTFSTLEADLSKRIDYILIQNTKEFKVMDIDVLPDKSRSQAASDHRALQATLSFDKSE